MNVDKRVYRDADGTFTLDESRAASLAYAVGDEVPVEDRAAVSALLNPGQGDHGDELPDGSQINHAAGGDPAAPTDADLNDQDGADAGEDQGDKAPAGEKVLKATTPSANKARARGEDK